MAPEHANPAPAQGFDGARLLRAIRERAQALGLSQIAVSDLQLGDTEAHLARWLEQGMHGSMDYMARHGMARARPSELLPGTLRVITARLDYLPEQAPAGWRAIEWQRLGQPQQAVVSLYARGRDYHRVLRQRLARLAEFIAEQAQPRVLRAFTDSAPVPEVALAARAGLGWRGKHSLLLHRDAGSMFFLGEIYTDLELPVDAPLEGHCGSCTRCLDVCPTRAIVRPYVVDARRCISYLSIELDGPIPEDLRAPMGNRVYGCDDCQLACPWNRWARPSPLPDFLPRHGLDRASLLELWAWDRAAFEARTEGSAIRRIGHARWRRNLAVALGNARRTLEPGDPLQPQIENALRAALPEAEALVAEHVRWALDQPPGGDAAAPAGAGTPGSP